jgi:2-amino-4-hydroxy-6-hydroxymethyldihydropteridine diphosphokinase
VSAVFSIGSNVGDRLANLQLAVDVVARLSTVRAVSSVYETKPVGGPAQPDYLNAVLLADSAEPTQLLRIVRAAERAAGRTRTVRHGPRTLDVDVIAVDDVRSDDPELELPHPRAHERAFVLLPWVEVDPSAVLPGHGPVAELARGSDRHGVRRRPELRLRGAT